MKRSLSRDHYANELTTTELLALLMKLFSLFFLTDEKTKVSANDKEEKAVLHRPQIT